ncbi:MAG TPA: sensor histidine kinase [Candidatus Eisenbacteria bacterium]|nr:sensor histidine kinase [Candidatus Eisenbacteria bacterium]
MHKRSGSGPKKSFRPRDGFGLRVAGLVLLIILPLYALIVLNIRDKYLEDRNDMYADASRIAHIVVEAQTGFIRSIKPLLVASSRLREVRTKQGEACSAIFAELLKSGGRYLNIGAVDANGEVFCSAVPLTHEANVSDLAWFRRTTATGRFSAGDFEVGKVTGVRAFSFGYPFYGDDGSLQGAVYASLDLRAIDEVLRAANVPPGTVLTEIDQNATVIARYPEIPGIVGTTIPDKPIARNVLGPLHEGTFTATGLDGVPRLYAFAHIDPTTPSSPYAIVGFDQSLLLAQIRRTLLFNVLGLLAVTLIVVLLAYEGLKEVVIRRLAAMEEVERLRNEFISLASHQLRTPITSVRWLLELLISGKPEPLTPQQTELATEAKRSADQLARLVKELVEVEKGDARSAAAPVPTDVGAVVLAAIDETRSVAMKREVTIETDFPEGLPKAMVDPMLMRQIAANLLTNALKYSPPRAIVTLRLAAARGRVRLEVTDRGIGIPAREQKRVFERFYRASNVVAVQGEGLGLGLYLSKLFAERMGGKIGFTSEEGKGATFWAEFPQATL